MLRMMSALSMAPDTRHDHSDEQHMTADKRRLKGETRHFSQDKLYTFNFVSFHISIYISI